MSNLRMIVPFYVYPSDNPQSQEFKDWQTILKHAREDPELFGLIINPASGPGPTTRDANYVRVIHELKKTPIKIYGYVPTGYGRRTIPNVLLDVSLWQELWGVTDIFCDECASDETKIAYYAELNAWVKGEVILNPGVEPDAKYLKCGNIICSAETDYESYMQKRFTLPATAGKNRFYHIALGVAASSLSAALEQARRNADYVYITDQVPNSDDDNPFDRLPGYFERLMHRLKEL